MWQDIKTHILHYLALFLILGLGLLGFAVFSYNHNLQKLIILALAIFYIGWGIVHHLLEDNLNAKIVVEYTSLAALAVTLIWLMIGVSS